ncbi:hypothetical protein GCM10022227_04940 [Streptomyces sedi]
MPIRRPQPSHNSSFQWHTAASLGEGRPAATSGPTLPVLKNNDDVRDGEDEVEGSAISWAPYVDAAPHPPSSAMIPESGDPQGGGEERMRKSEKVGNFSGPAYDGGKSITA